MTYGADEVTQFLEWMAFDTDYFVCEYADGKLDPLKLSIAALVAQYQKGRK